MKKKKLRKLLAEANEIIEREHRGWCAAEDAFAKLRETCNRTIAERDEAMAELRRLEEKLELCRKANSDLTSAHKGCVERLRLNDRAHSSNNAETARELAAAHAMVGDLRSEVLAERDLHKRTAEVMKVALLREQDEVARLKAIIASSDTPNCDHVCGWMCGGAR